MLPTTINAIRKEGLKTALIGATPTTRFPPQKEGGCSIPLLMANSSLMWSFLGFFPQRKHCMVGNTCTRILYSIDDGFHGAFLPWELEGITSPCCLLIGQYPHHMTLCPPVTIVKRCYGTRLYVLPTCMWSRTSQQQSLQETEL